MEQLVPLKGRALLVGAADRGAVGTPSWPVDIISFVPATAARPSEGKPRMDETFSEKFLRNFLC